MGGLESDDQTRFLTSRPPNSGRDCEHSLVDRRLDALALAMHADCEHVQN